MYKVQGKWHLLRLPRVDASARVCHLVLIKQSPFLNEHPVLEPELIGSCLARDADAADALAQCFIRIADRHGVFPPSPFTQAISDQLCRDLGL